LLSRGRGKEANDEEASNQPRALAPASAYAGANNEGGTGVELQRLPWRIGSVPYLKRASTYFTESKIRSRCPRHRGWQI